MIAREPDPQPPVTDEDLKRLREICEAGIKSGHVGVTVIAQDVLRVITEFEQLRAVQRAARSGPN